MWHVHRRRLIGLCSHRICLLSWDTDSREKEAFVHASLYIFLFINFKRLSWIQVNIDKASSKWQGSILGKAMAYPLVREYTEALFRLFRVIIWTGDPPPTLPGRRTGVQSTQH